MTLTQHPGALMDDDEYPSCHTTYATLCIYPGDVDPAAITDRLGIEPSNWQRRGEVTQRPGRAPKVAPLDGWFLMSRGQVESRDSRRHIDWLLDRLESRAEAVRSLREVGCRLEIACYWLARRSNGGPTLPALQMKRLAEFDIELWFDFYGPVDEDDA